ncbi:glycosyltransferase family 39 protein, partial [bacterium AH-315-F18]|nr:glycosyltransferase family 39 protein [bacterium AH-315-F18]
MSRPTTAVNRTSTVATLFFILAATVCFIHFRVESTVRGNLPPHSDSLVYQNAALFDLELFQRSELTIEQFFFGTGVQKILPPVHRWSLVLGYVILGTESSAPYLVSSLWLLLCSIALFFCIRAVTDDEWWAAASGLILLGLPASLHFGFADTRNDWPVATLILWAFYFLITSDVLKNPKRVAYAAVFLSLATLTKGSTLGYLSLPVLFALTLLFVFRKNLTGRQWRNVALCACLPVALAGW